MYSDLSLEVYRMDDCRRVLYYRAVGFAEAISRIYRQGEQKDDVWEKKSLVGCQERGFLRVRGGSDEYL
jgi:hypothetical protein